MSRIDNVESTKIPGSLYIAVEGSEGVGKSTWLTYFYQFLTSRQQTLLVREPGFTHAGKILREKVLSSEQPLKTQIELFRADRILTQELCVKPYLDKGNLVLSDRSVLSNLVYQGKMRGKFDEVMKLHTDMKNFIFPDLTIIGYVPLDVALSRIGKRRQTANQEHNYFDDKEREFHEALHKHFSEAGEWYPYPIVFVDFNRSVEEITQDVLKKIEDKVGMVL